MSYIFSKHEFDLLKKLSGIFYDEYDDRIRLGEEHIIRELPNGVKDEINVTTGVKTQNVSGEIVLNGSENWLSNDSNDEFYQLKIDDWAIVKNALQSTDNSGIGYCVDGDFPVVRSISPSTWTRGISFGHVSQNGRLYINIEKAKIDPLTGANRTEKFKAYLNAHPISLNYQLAEPVEIPLPENMDPNTTEIVRLSEKLDKAIKAIIVLGGTII